MSQQRRLVTLDRGNCVINCRFTIEREKHSSDFGGTVNFIVLFLRKFFQISIADET